MLFPESWDGMSVAGAFADAPAPIAKTPAAAHKGTAVFAEAIFERFCLNPCLAFIAEPLYAAHFVPLLTYHELLTSSYSQK
jgi:hypothetical protein